MDEALKALVAEVTAHAASRNGKEVDNFDPDAEHVNIASTARKYKDIVCQTFHLLDEHDKDLPVYWALKNWHHRLQMAPVYAHDEVFLGEIVDEAFDREELRPGEVMAFVLANDREIGVEGPYPTDEENQVFFEAQRGGYSHDSFGLSDLSDDHDTRNLVEGWAEYLEPVGMPEFYGSAEWKWLRARTSRAIQEADELGASEKWSHVAGLIRPAVEEAFDAAVKLYLDGHINTVSMALIVHKFVSATRFSREEMVRLTRLIPGKSHVDGTDLGVSLFKWMGWYQEELDEVLEDAWEGDWSPRFASEEAYVAEEWAGHFESQMETHWVRQAKARTPALEEEGKKLWASCFAGLGDVAYNLAYFRAVAADLPMPEVLAAANNARKEHKWVPNLVVVSADQRGLVMSDDTFLRWNQAAEQVGRLTVQPGRQEGLLAKMRRVYARANGDRPHIAAVGKVIAIAGL
jgi:hypothetical protein